MFEGRPERPPPRPPRIKSKDMYLDVTPQNNVAEHAAAAAAAAAFALLILLVCFFVCLSTVLASNICWNSLQSHFF